MYEIHSLEGVSFEDLAVIHNQAFADYVTPMTTTPRDLEAYFKVAGVSRAQSFGVFWKGELVGMLVNALDVYNGKLVAYDAMTCIVKQHRGKGLFTLLYERARRSLKNEGIAEYWLEVIATNTGAYNVYKSKGARVTREFLFWKGCVEGGTGIQPEIEVLPLPCGGKEEVCLYSPSFANRLAALRRDAQSHHLVRVREEPKGAAVVCSGQGRIYQIRCREGDESTLKAILASLSERYGSLKVSNIPLGQDALNHALGSMGLEVLVRQYEMCMAL